MCSGTNSTEVARMMSPRMIDLVAAAPTKPSVISKKEIGADSSS